MDMRRFRPVVLLGALAVVAAGCSTTGGGGSQTENTVAATHRLVQKLDTSLSPSIERLNTTAAELSARVESNDQETRRLQGVVQENQVKLDQLQRRLDELTAALYRNLNLSPPPGVGAQTQAPGATPPPPRSDVESRGVVVQAPSESAPTETVAGGAVAAGPDEDALYVRARQLYANEEYQQALREFDEFLRLYPASANAANAQYWKAYCYFKMNDFQAYIREADKLIATYPDSLKVPVAMHNQAVAYSRLGQNERAEATFKDLIAKFPNDVVTESAREQLQRLQQTRN